MKKFIKNVDTIINLSEERKLQGDLIGAISVLLNDCLYSKKSAIVYKKLGELYILTGDYDSALYYFLKYVEVCPKKDIGEGYQLAGTACIKNGKNKLALGFFNEQWECDGTREYNYSDEVVDFLNSMEELEKRPRFTAVKKGKDCDFYEEGAGLYYAKAYESALDRFSMIKSNSKYYGKALYKSALCYFMLDESSKAVKKFEEYFNNFSPTVEQYCCYINVLDVISFDKPSYKKKRDLYLNKLYSKKITDNYDNYYIAEFSVSLFNDYEKALKYLNTYLKEEPYDDGALFIKGMCLYCSDKKEEGINYVKKAYLLTHYCKYKYVLTELRKGLENDNYKIDKVFSYPENEVERYEARLNACLNDETEFNSLTESELLELVDFSVFVDKQDFWELFLKVLSKGKKRYFIDILADILIEPQVDVEIKSIVIENLVYNGYSGERGILFPDYFVKVQLFPADLFIDKAYKRAYSYVCGKFPVMIDEAFIIKVKELEDKYLFTRINCKLEDLAGAIFYYANDFGKKCNVGFFRVLGTNKKRSKDTLDKILSLSQGEDE